MATTIMPDETQVQRIRDFGEWVMTQETAARDYATMVFNEDPRSRSYCTASRSHWMSGTGRALPIYHPEAYVLSDTYQPVRADFDTMSAWMAMESTKPDHGKVQVARTEFDDGSTVLTLFTGFDQRGNADRGTPALFRTVCLPEGILDVRVSSVDDALTQHTRTVREYSHGTRAKPVNDVRLDRQAIGV